jgi:hypothetical protein
MFNNLALKNRQVCPDYDQRVAGNSKQQNISADNLFLNALLCQYGYLHPVLQLQVASEPLEWCCKEIEICLVHLLAMFLTI